MNKGASSQAKVLLGVVVWLMSATSERAGGIT